MAQISKATKTLFFKSLNNLFFVMDESRRPIRGVGRKKKGFGTNFLDAHTINYLKSQWVGLVVCGENGRIIMA
jgi:hypothetical protein